MPIEEFVFFGYRGLSAIVALVMALVVLRSYDWRHLCGHDLRAICLASCGI